MGRKLKLIGVALYDWLASHWDLAIWFLLGALVGSLWL